MKKILVVDDDEGATDLLKTVLTVNNYLPIIVNNSSETIQAAKSSSPDLILLDLMMPEPDGFKVCRMLREDPDFKSIPIVIVTALDDTDSMIVAFGAGADKYITKPYPVDELITIIEDLLQQDTAVG